MAGGAFGGVFGTAIGGLARCGAPPALLAPTGPTASAGTLSLTCTGGDTGNCPAPDGVLALAPREGKGQGGDPREPPRPPSGGEGSKDSGHGGGGQGGGAGKAPFKGAPEKDYSYEYDEEDEEEEETSDDDPVELPNLTSLPACCSCPRQGTAVFHKTPRPAEDGVHPSPGATKGSGPPLQAQGEVAREEGEEQGPEEEREGPPD